MKTAFNMILYYCAAVVAGTLLAASIYMISCDLTMLVAGEKLKFFNWDFFIRGVVTVFPLAVMVVLGLILFYGIRHRENHFLRLGTYIFLCAVSWLIVIPVSFDFGNKYTENFAKKYEVPYLSSGYFRPEAGGIFFFSRVAENGTADGVFIDITGITGEQGKIVKFNNSIIDEDFSGQFADTLIRDSIKLPFVIIAPLELYSTVILKAKEAWSKGYVSYLVFLTFILALCSVVALQYLSSWRMINGLAVMLAGGIVCLINYAYHYGLIFKDTGASWSAYFMQLSSQSTGFLKALFAADNPLLAVINLVIFAVLLCTGTLLYFVRGRKEGGEE